MGLFKKNPVFCILCATAALVFVGGCALVVMESGKLAKSKKQVASADSQIKGLLHASPAPTSENVQAAQKNVEELNAKLLSIRENLQRGSRLTVSSDGTRVMSSLHKYVLNYRKQVAEHKDVDGEDAVIEVPEEFAFGFDRYMKKSEIPEDATVVPVLDKQRQILSYILNQLLAADPVAIKAVERELQGNAAENNDKAFQINPAISARVPGAIDTLAFRVTFTGYTPALRKFLNSLAQFDLPIVVRSVEVDRPSLNDKPAKKKRPSNSLDDIFGAFGGASSSEVAPAAAAPKKTQTPVISETESTFTVTLEFIEIILPSTSEENPS